MPRTDGKDDNGPFQRGRRGDPAHRHPLWGGGWRTLMVCMWLENSFKWAKENKIPSTPTPSTSRLHRLYESMQPFHSAGPGAFEHHPALVQ